MLDNNEISSCGNKPYGEAGSIMYNNGFVYSNDIEMVLKAFSTNKWQYAIDLSSPKRNKSRVIRLPQKFKP